MTRARKSSAAADLRVPARALAAASDVALILDEDEQVVDLWVGEGIEASEGWKGLTGREWTDALAPDSRRKVDKLVADAQDGKPTSARELNFVVPGVGDVPLRCTAIRLDAEHVLVLGRDLRPVARMQQQLVGAQQSIDREYSRLRQLDTRYRVLFHVCAEGVLVASAQNLRIIDANPAAATMLGESARALEGRTLDEIFEPEGRAALHAMLSAVEAGGHPSELQLKLLGEVERVVTVAATLFRQASSPLVLLRFWSVGGASSAFARASRTMAVLDALPDGFVVTSEDRHILSANSAFCEMVSQANENQVIGESLERWIGRPGVDMNIILGNLREHGVLRNFPTIVRSEFGGPQEALVTAVSANDGKVPCIGFTIRAASSRLAPLAPTSSVMVRSVDQLRALVGRVSLKDLVRESADLIERLCIQAALDVSGDNRASAAQLLGLSRQGLYLKMKRHGLAEFAST